MIAAPAQPKGGSTAEFVDLPHELKSLICRPLTWPVHFRLLLTTKSFFEEGWALAENIRYPPTDGPGLALLSTRPFAQLASLRYLVLEFANPFEIIFEKLAAIPKLQVLRLAWLGETVDAAFTLPASLTSLKLTGEFSTASAKELFLHICDDLKQLNFLHLTQPLPAAILPNLSKLTNLEYLRLPNVPDVPDWTQPELISALLRSLPPGLKGSNSHPTIGWFDFPYVMDDFEKDEMPRAKVLLEAGFRPEPVATYARAICDVGLGRQYIDDGWVKPEHIRYLLYELLMLLQTPERLAAFAELAFLPALALNVQEASEKPEFSGKSAEEIKAAVASQMLMVYDKKGGLSIPAWVFGHRYFTAALFSHPEMIHVDIAAIQTPIPLHFFAVEARMEEYFVAQGHPVDTSDRRLNVLLKVWRAVNNSYKDLEWIRPKNPTFDPLFVFSKMMQNRVFFAKNGIECVRLAGASASADGVVDIFLELANFEFDRPFFICLAECLFDEIDESTAEDITAIAKQTPELADAFGVHITTLGVFVLAQQFGFDQLAASEITHGQNILHVLLRDANLNAREKFRRMTRLVIQSLPLDSPLLQQADDLGHLPLYNWVYILFTRPIGATYMVRLIRHFATSLAAVVDAKGTTIAQLLDHFMPRVPQEMLSIVTPYIEELRAAFAQGAN